MKHVLPPLPYGYAALAPTIDARTMTLHYGAHHAAYVKALNEALEKAPELQDRTALWLLLHSSKIPKAIRSAVHHNAGGHVNHSLFWRAMSPRGGGLPSGLLADAIDHEFGSFELFKDEFVKAGTKQFASGWVWLARAHKRSGKLEIVTTAGHENPIIEGLFPILLNDVWEHAYYLQYENLRADYLKNWWAVVNWEEASHRFEQTADTTENRLDVAEVVLSQRN